ncbi:MAG: hypothetical protein K0Q49_1248 [Haloplasmataceae bacterium]|jgi:hypothetical protein|nr:hypothetical protein [Haloplasmataceae bacterium]
MRQTTKDQKDIKSKGLARSTLMGSSIFTIIIFFFNYNKDTLFNLTQIILLSILQGIIYGLIYYFIQKAIFKRR